MIDFYKATILDVHKQFSVIDCNATSIENAMRDLAYTMKEQGYLIVKSEKNKMVALMSHAIVSIHIEPCPKDYIDNNKV